MECFKSSIKSENKAKSLFLYILCFLYYISNISFHVFLHFVLTWESNIFSSSHSPRFLATEPVRLSYLFFSIMINCDFVRCKHSCTSPAPLPVVIASVPFTAGSKVKVMHHAGLDLMSCSSSSEDKKGLMHEGQRVLSLGCAHLPLRTCSFFPPREFLWLYNYQRILICNFRLLLCLLKYDQPSHLSYP